MSNYYTRSEPFQLSMLGGTIERRFHNSRAKLDFAWGALAETKLPDDLRAEAQSVWTRLAYIEYRSASAMTAVTEALIAARAPLDLTAIASTFALDELSHAEMAARVLGELGGAEYLAHTWKDLIYLKPRMDLHPLVRAAEQIIRVFCVAEAFALPMAKLVARKSEELPLVGEILHRIAKDEASHASFGWIFLDWAADWMTDEDRTHLAGVAQTSIDLYRGLVTDRGDEPGATFGWLSDLDFKTHGQLALADDVIAPLIKRGIEVH